MGAPTGRVLERLAGFVAYGVPTSDYTVSTGFVYTFWLNFSFKLVPHGGPFLFDHSSAFSIVFGLPRLMTSSFGKQKNPVPFPKSASLLASIASYAMSTPCIPRFDR